MNPSLLFLEAEVRSTLFATPEAQVYLTKHPESDPNNIRSALVEGDNALHVALKTKCFHHIDLSKHAKELHVKNSNGETPADLALRLGDGSTASKTDAFAAYLTRSLKP